MALTVAVNDRDAIALGYALGPCPRCGRSERRFRCGVGENGIFWSAMCLNCQHAETGSSREDLIGKWRERNGAKDAEPAPQPRFDFEANAADLCEAAKRLREAADLIEAVAGRL